MEQKKETQLTVFDKPQTQPTPSDLIAMATDKNLDIEKLKSLYGLQEKYIARVSREAFVWFYRNLQE